MSRGSRRRPIGPPVHVDSTGAGEPVYEFTQRSKAALVDSLAILFEKKRIVLPEAVIWPEAIDELEAFEYSVSDAGNVKTSAPPGIHDDIVMALALATFMPGRFDPDVKPNPRALLSLLGRASAEAPAGEVSAAVTMVVVTSANRRRSRATPDSIPSRCGEERRSRCPSEVTSRGVEKPETIRLSISR